MSLSSKMRDCQDMQAREPLIKSRVFLLIVMHVNRLGVFRL